MLIFLITVALYFFYFETFWLPNWCLLLSNLFYFFLKYNACSWMMALLQIVELGRFHTHTCRTEIIHLRCAAIDLRELAVLATTGLLVRNLPFSLLSSCYCFYSLEVKSITHRLVAISPSTSVGII